MSDNCMLSGMFNNELLVMFVVSVKSRRASCKGSRCVRLWCVHVSVVSTAAVRRDTVTAGPSAPSMPSAKMKLATFLTTLSSAFIGLRLLIMSCYRYYNYCSNIQNLCALKVIIKFACIATVYLLLHNTGALCTNYAVLVKFILVWVTESPCT